MCVASYDSMACYLPRGLASSCEDYKDLTTQDKCVAYLDQSTSADAILLLNLALGLCLEEMNSGSFFSDHSNNFGIQGADSVTLSVRTGLQQTYEHQSIWSIWVSERRWQHFQVHASGWADLSHFPWAPSVGADIGCKMVSRGPFPILVNDLTLLKLLLELSRSLPPLQAEWEH